LGVRRRATRPEGREDDGTGHSLSEQHGISDPQLAKALAHPLRVRILAALEESTASPSELASRLGEPVGTVAYHVRVLAGRGLVRLVGTSQRRGALVHHYAAVAQPPIGGDTWALDVDPGNPHGGALAQAATAIRAAAAGGGFNRPEAHLTRNALTLDPQGWADLAGAVSSLLERVRRIEADANARMGNHSEPGQAAELLLMLFETGAKQPE
jgi:DNA-binding transcriptional ArsR family regulator